MFARNSMKVPILAALLLLASALRAKDVSVCEVAPLPKGIYQVSSPFGPRVHPLSHVWRMHWGIDLKCPVGTPVSAVSNGVVLFAGRWGCYGNVVILYHPGEIITLYAHLSRIFPGLCRGVRVRAGQVIALSGATGCVTGPHVHFECWLGSQRRRVNPVLVCAPLCITHGRVRL